MPAECLILFPVLQCTVTCGGGVQTRSVHCVQQGRPSSSCLLQQKPPVLRACNTNFCPAPEKRGKSDPYTPILLVFREFFKHPLFGGAARTRPTSRGCHSHQSPRERCSLEAHKAQIQVVPAQSDLVCREHLIL